MFTYSPHFYEYVATGKWQQTINTRARRHLATIIRYHKCQGRRRRHSVLSRSSPWLQPIFVHLRLLHLRCHLSTPDYPWIE